VTIAVNVPVWYKGSFDSVQATDAVLPAFVEWASVAKVPTAVWLVSDATCEPPMAVAGVLSVGM